MKHCFWACIAALLGLPVSMVGAAELLVGAASVDMTPPEPVALDGQFNLRIAKTVETPVTANIIALQTREGDRAGDAVVTVSCDLVGTPPHFVQRVREAVGRQVPDLDVGKIFLNATHTHTAPVLYSGKYPLPDEGVMPVEKTLDYMAGRIAEGIARAWAGRAPGSFTWGLSHAVVAHHRRAVFADGTAVMYGQTNAANFRGLEGYEDHDIGTLFFWNAEGKLIALAVNVACPAQEVEGRSAVHADFFHAVRESLHQRFGNDVCVAGWIAAAGDQSPHLMYRKAADDRMRELRGLDRLQEIARRIDLAVDEAYQTVKNDRHSDVSLVHDVQTMQLPMRLVTEAEYAEAKTACEQSAAELEKNPAAADQVHRRMKWFEETVARFESQKTNPAPTLDAEIHVVRLGDTVICTNPFELFTDFGVAIKARSEAAQTFVIQLVGRGSYLPTERAVRGGGYSAVVHSSLVGPEGGWMLVDQTVDRIHAIWSGGK